MVEAKNVMKEDDAYLESCSDMALLKDVARGREDAFMVLLDRYLDVVSVTSFRILCDREDSEAVTVKVFVSLWHDVLAYDDSLSLRDFLLRKTCLYSRMRIMRRRILMFIGVRNGVFVKASPKVENEDDYVTKQAWELYCRATAHMNPLQTIVYVLCELEGMLQDDVSRLIGLTHFRVSLACQRAVAKMKGELHHFNREDDYMRFTGFLKKVAESLTDREKLTKSILKYIEI